LALKEIRLVNRISFIMTDLELIKGCIADDRRSQNALYKKYFPLLSSIARRYAANEDDIIFKLNGGFYKVLTNLHKFDHQYSPATFIRNIMINYFIDEFRKEKKYFLNIELKEEGELESGITFNEGALNIEAEELFSILKHLPEVTRKVFNLFAIDGFKHEEISTMLGISTGTSKWHVNEARRQLKIILEATAKKENQPINSHVKL